MKKGLLILFGILLTASFAGCATTEETPVPLTDAAQLYGLFDAALVQSGSRATQSFTLGVRRINPATEEVIRETEIYAVFLSGGTRRISYLRSRTTDDGNLLFRKVIDEAPAGTFTEYATTDPEGTLYQVRPYGYDLDLDTYFSDFYKELPAVIAQYGIPLSDLLETGGISRNDSYRRGDAVYIDVGFSTDGEEAGFWAVLENGYLVYAQFSNPEEYHIVAEFWVGECLGIGLPEAAE